MTSSSPTADVARELAQATRAGVSLADALDAAAEGSPNRRLRLSLRSIAERVRRGETLDHILASGSFVPPYVAGLATGRPAFAIAQWLFLRERARSHWREVVASLAYLLATLLGTYIVFLFLSLYVVPDLKGIIDNFGIKIPAASQAIFIFTQQGAPLSLILFGSLAAILLLTRLIGGRSVWSQVISAAPIIGPLWHWSGSSELLRALALMLDHQIPLPTALKLTGQGIADAALGKHCTRLANRVEQGSTLAQAMQSQLELPASVLPLVRSGEHSGTLPAALVAAAEMLEARLQTQSAMVLQLAPTVIFFLIVGMALMIVAGVGIPLVSLIQGLT